MHVLEDEGLDVPDGLLPLAREESCGGHFREEYQTAEGEALRNDEKFCHVAAWEYKGDNQAPVRHVESLVFENVHLATRSYK